MTRRYAIETIYQIINSGIIDMDLEEELQEVVNCIENDEWEETEEEEWEEDEEY